MLSLKAHISAINKPHGIAGACLTDLIGLSQRGETSLEKGGRRGLYYYVYIPILYRLYYLFSNTFLYYDLLHYLYINLILLF